jgi:hypothetical protein
MSEKEEMTKFMRNKHTKTASHPKPQSKEENEGDYLSQPQRPIKKTVETPVRQSQDLGKILNIVIMIPVISIGIASFAFFVFKIMPPIIGIIRSFFIALVTKGK